MLTISTECRKQGVSRFRHTIDNGNSPYLYTTSSKQNTNVYKYETASVKQNLAMSETVSSKCSLHQHTICITPNNFLLQANLASIKHENRQSHIKYPLSSKMRFFFVTQDQILTSMINLLCTKQPQAHKAM